MKLSGIETATFWLVGQCINQLRHQQRAPFENLRIGKRIILKCNFTKYGERLWSGEFWL
jgi:hypothetical protein